MCIELPWKHVQIFSASIFDPSGEPFPTWGHTLHLHWPSFPPEIRCVPTHTHTDVQLSHTSGKHQQLRDPHGAWTYLDVPGLVEED